jgi:GTP-binding protein LepA
VLIELEQTFGFGRDEVLQISAKTGDGVAELLEQIVDRVEPPAGDVDDNFRALIFDSKYDQFKGVIAYVRAMHGSLKSTDRIRLMGTGTEAEVLETGYFSPVLEKTSGLMTGEVGYVATGLKDVKAVRVGDTMTIATDPAEEALPGYAPQSPMVFTGIFPIEGEDYPELRDALDKLQLNDAALVFEPGFRFPMWFFGIAPYGHRSGATRKGIRPRSDSNGTECELQRAVEEWRDDHDRQSFEAARSQPACRHP